MGEGLHFRALRLNNWKNFVKVEVEVRQRLFLVGPNAVGKSNLLDVFRFLRDLALPGGGFQEAVSRRGGVSAIRCLAARQRSDVEIRVVLQQGDTGPQWTYELVFHQNAQRQSRVKRETVRRDAEEVLARPDDDDRLDAARLTQTHLEQVNANQKFRDLAAFFASVRYLHIVPQLIREPDRYRGPTNDPYGSDFLERVAKTPDRTRRGRLKRIQRALQAAVPQLQEIKLWRDARGTPHLQGKYEHWRPHGAWQSEDQFSDGTLRLMGLLWAAMDKEGLLLLEEPELSLHPELIRRLPQLFARVQRLTGRQIFVSTHSPELLRDDGIGLDEVLLLTPAAESTTVTVAGTLAEARALVAGGLSVAEVVIPKTRPEGTAVLPLFPDL